MWKFNRKLSDVHSSGARDGISRFVFNPPCTYKNKNHCDRQYQILGAFTFWPTYKVVHFPKIRTRKKKKKKLDASALARKEPHKEVGVCEVCFLGCRPRPGPRQASLLHVVQMVFQTLCSPPLPQTDPPLQQRRAWRRHLLGRDCRNRATGLDRPDKGTIPLTGCAAWLLLLFS